jgi:hypothetical protein
MATTLAFCDTETTSLRPDRVIWEVAIIVRKPGLADVEHQWFVSGVAILDADPMALSIGGFYDRHPEWAAGRMGTPFVRTTSDARPELQGWAATASKIESLTRGAVIVGRNPAFDTEGFANLLRARGLPPSWNYHLCDVTQMAVGYLHHSRGDAVRARHLGRVEELDHVLQPPWKTDDLAAACGLAPQPAEAKHTALGDARAVRDWYDLMTSDLAVPEDLRDQREATV